MGRFEQAGLGPSGNEVSPVQFNPEALIRTTINRALRAAESKYGHNRFVFVDEVTNEKGNLESIILVDPEQALDSSHPKKLVKMSKTEDGRWEAEEFVPM
jgi:hypothetical protein